MGKYFVSVFSHSGLRKLYYTYDTKYEQKNENIIITRPILYTHRIIHCLFAGIMGIGLAPMYFEHIEIYIRNIAPVPKHSKHYEENNFYTVLWDMHKSE